MKTFSFGSGNYRYEINLSDRFVPIPVSGAENFIIAAFKNKDNPKEDFFVQAIVGESASIPLFVNKEYSIEKIRSARKQVCETKQINLVDCTDILGSGPFLFSMKTKNVDGRRYFTHIRMNPIDYYINYDSGGVTSDEEALRELSAAALSFRETQRGGFWFAIKTLFKEKPLVVVAGISFWLAYFGLTLACLIVLVCTIFKAKRDSLSKTGKAVLFIAWSAITAIIAASYFWK